MVCNKCGKNIDQTMNFCPYCQNRIEKNANQNGMTYQYTNYTQNQTTNYIGVNSNISQQGNTNQSVNEQQHSNINPTLELLKGANVQNNQVDYNTQNNYSYQNNTSNPVVSNNFNVENNQINNIINQQNYNQTTNNQSNNNNQFSNGTIPPNIVNNSNSFNNNYNKKKKNFIPLIIIFAIILLVFVVLFIIGKSDEEKPQSLKPTYDNELTTQVGNRTMMIYIIGSNLESEGASATDDITEMVNSKFDTDDINVVLYVGGTTKWNNDHFDENENAIYEVNGKNVNKIKSYPKKNMANPSTLTEFIDYVYQNYDSELYSLVLWDHGGGPIYGYGSDENYKNSDPMSILELDKAINDSQLIKNTKFEFIGFDACLMSSIEIANVLKEEANYLIASSETIPGSGWDYEFLSEINDNTSTKELGKLIIDYYNDYYKMLKTYASIYGYSYEPDITLSMVDLNKIDSLVDSVDNLFKNLDTSITINTYSKISREVSKAVMYGYQENKSIQYDLIDLYDLVDELDGYDNEISKVKQEINNTIVYHKTNIDDCYGMSMYFPITTKKSYNTIENEYDYDELIVSENYKKFLNQYIKIATGDKLVKSSISTLIPETTTSDIYATLPTDVANNYQTANYLVFRKIEDGSYLPIYKSQDIAISGNIISATVANRRISVGDVNGQDLEDVIAYEVSRDEDYIIYSLTTILQYWDDSDFFGTLDTDAVDIYFKVDRKTNEGNIIDIKPITDDTTSPKITYNLNDWTHMQFLSSSYFLYDENGNKLDDWQKSGVMYGTDVKISDGYKILVSELDKNEEYYYMFRVKDTQGNIYETDLVKAK